MRVYQLLQATKLAHDNLKIKFQELEKKVYDLENRNNQLEAELNLTKINRDSLNYERFQLLNTCEQISQELVNCRFNHWQTTKRCKKPKK